MNRRSHLHVHGTPMHDHGDHHSNASDAHPTTRANETLATDPVCGMKVDPSAAAGSYEYSGVTYHFCSTHCLAKFKADPDKFDTPNKPREAMPAAPGAKYTCPMHPE